MSAIMSQNGRKMAKMLHNATKSLTGLVRMSVTRHHQKSLVCISVIRHPHEPLVRISVIRYPHEPLVLISVTRHIRSPLVRISVGGPPFTGRVTEAINAA